MPAVIDPVIKQQVIVWYLQGVSRDTIAVDDQIGTGTVSNIIDEWKKGVQGSDYECVRELAIHCKKEDVNLEDLLSASRIKNYIKQLSTIDEERVEQLIARYTASQDPQKLVDVLEKVGRIDVPLEELEEIEKETLLHEKDEALAIVNSLNVDRQIIDDFKELKNEMDKYHLEDPKKFLNVPTSLEEVQV